MICYLNEKDTREKYKVRLGAIEIGQEVFNSDTKLLENVILPYYGKKNATFKTLTCKFLFEGITSDEIEINLSNFFNDAKECSLSFSNSKLNYKVELDGYGEYRKINKVQRIIKINFRICETYKKTIEEKLINENSRELINNGNTETPCIVEITPNYTDIVDIKIEGLSEDTITIKNLHKNITVIVDGELGLVTEEGKNKFSDTDMWEFPRLKAGVNTIKLSREDCNVVIKYKERYV